MGKIFVFCRIQVKFRFWSYKKRWHTSWKFQLVITSNKKVIAKKPLTKVYEMNSSFTPISAMATKTIILNQTVYDHQWCKVMFACYVIVMNCALIMHRLSSFCKIYVRNIHIQTSFQMVFIYLNKGMCDNGTKTIKVG